MIQGVARSDSLLRILPQALAQEIEAVLAHLEVRGDRCNAGVHMGDQLLLVVAREGSLLKEGLVQCHADTPYVH